MEIVSVRVKMVSVSKSGDGKCKSGDDECEKTKNNRLSTQQMKMSAGTFLKDYLALTIRMFLKESVYLWFSNYYSRAYKINCRYLMPPLIGQWLILRVTQCTIT